MSAKPADRTEEVPMSSPTVSQKLTAEAIGTAILVFIGAGSVPLTILLKGPDNPFGSAELSTISFAFAFAIFAAVYSVGHISGCHINPAVTTALWATKKIDSQTAVSYILAQLVGAFIGAGLTLVILSGNHPETLGLGAVGVTKASGNVIGFFAELIGTAILVFTVFGAAVDGRAPAGFAGIVIGFIVYGIIILVGPINGAALNPARQVGPEVLEAIIGKAQHWDQIWVSIPRPIAGGLVGAFLYEFVGHHATAPVPGIATPELAHADG